MTFWRLYAEVHLEPSTRRKYRCLWNKHIEKRLGTMELRQITPLVLSEFILELQQAGAGAPTVRSCLVLLQSIFARAVEWDRARVNVVKLIAKPRVRRAPAIKPLRPDDVEALRRKMLRHPKHGLRNATLVSVLAYAGLRPEETLALIREGEHSIVQIAEWMGHSPATLLSHYAHVLADIAGKSATPGERAIGSAHRARAIHASSSTSGDGRGVARWTIGSDSSRTTYYSTGSITC